MNIIRTSQLAFIFLFIFLCSFPLRSNAASNEPLRVYVNGYQVLFTQPPIVEDGNTLVQLRPIFESLGIQIGWDEKTQRITGNFKDSWEIVMTINSTSATINGKRTTLSAAPRIINETAFVPLRFIGESVGGDVTWDEKTNQVDIIDDKGYYVFLAASKNDMEKVKYWLEHGGASNFSGKDGGLTTLGVAIQHKNIEMIQLLLKFGADPNHSLSRFGDSIKPLDLAIVDKDPVLVQLLVDYGADASHRTLEGTSLDLAKKNQKETQATDRQKLNQIIEILEKAIQKDSLLLSEDKVLIPFNGGNKMNIFAGETGSWGYLDNTGSIAIKTKFARAFPFSEGLAFAVTKDGRQVGYIDKTGRFRITFDFIPKWFPGEFKEGLAPVGKNGKWGFIDKTGAFVIAPLYDDAQSFSAGVAAVKKGEKWGLINHSGDVVVEPAYEWIFKFNNGLALVRGEHSGFINTNGELIINFNELGISEYGQFVDGYAPVRKDGKSGFINTKGQFVIPPKYDRASEFGEGSAAVSIDGKYGYIDSSGQLIIQPQFDFAASFHNGQAFVKQDGKWGFINTKGDMIVPPSFTDFDSIMEGYLGMLYPAFSVQANGMALLRKDNQIYYVLPDGKIIEFIKQE